MDFPHANLSFYPIYLKHTQARQSMTTKMTFIKGKDRDLESTIETMLSKLDIFGIKVEEVSWLNPAPHVYSVHIRDKECGLMFTNGKGASQKSSFASALGEFFERLSCNYFFADYYLGKEFAEGEFVHYPDEKWFEISSELIPEGLLDEDLWEYYDPEYELRPEKIIDTNAGLSSRGICALPFVRAKDAETLWFPVNIIANLYVSNGMAAGNTVFEARVQALSEIFERYVKNKIISEGICLPEIPHAKINQFPKIQEAIQKILDYGYYLRIADASLGGIYPVISVTLINPKNGSVFASFGAHPCFEVALERTVTELLQGRDMSAMDDFQSPSFNMDEVADTLNLETHFINASGLISYDFFKQKADYKFVDWNYDSKTQDEFEYLVEIIHVMGFEIYIADYEHLNVYACRIIIPGMSEIYTVDDLQWSNNNEGAFFREAILSLKNLKKDAWRSLLERLEENSIEDMKKVAEFIGVIPDPQTAWADLQIGELKAMLALALQEYALAQEWISWCLHMAQIDEKRLLHYRCLHALIEIEMDEEKELCNYIVALEWMYAKENIEICLALIEGDVLFYGLHSPGLSLNGFLLHKKLLDAYAKVHQAKKEHWNKPKANS